MTKEFKYLMYLFSCGAKGCTPHPPEDGIDWGELIQQANSHSVGATAAYALMRADADLCPDALARSFISGMKRKAISAYMRNRQILRLLNDFERNGIRTAVLKGFSAARYYAAPECRISCDTDLYISQKDEPRAYDLLGRHGFTVHPRGPKTHHAVCDHPQMGCVELHTTLYDEIVEDVWFDCFDEISELKDPYDRIQTEDGDYDTLGKADNLVFLILHMIKHFIISGMSLSMMMDTALFYRQNAAQINTERLWQTVTRLKFGELLESILGAMIIYCGFTQSDFPGLKSYDPEKAEMVLEDLEAGGWLGHNDKPAREDGWAAYSRQKLIARKNVLHYRFHMLKWNAHNYWRALFPNRCDLARQYPYIEKCAWLIPYAWCRQFMTHGKRLVLSRRIQSHVVKKDAILSDIGIYRINLFRSLGMIE